MRARRLEATELRSYLPRLREQLGTADRQRLEKLPELFEEGRLRLSRVLDALYPDQSAQAAQAALRNFRGALKRACDEARLPLCFAVDTRKQTPPEERWCWFEGQGLDEVAADEISAAETSVTDPDKTVAPRARVEGRVRYCVVCAPADHKRGRELIAALRVQLASSRRHRFEGWAPWETRVGRKRDKEARRQAEQSLCLLVLVTPALLADKSARELVTRAQSQGRLIVPVRLAEVDGERQDLWGLKGLQFFQGDKPYAACNSQQKDRFALDLFRALDDSIADWQRRPDAPAPVVAEVLPADAIELPDLPREFIRTKARHTSVRLAGEAPGATQRPDESVDALEHLERWAADPRGAPLCALLGEYGSGKTTTCQRLTQRLAEARAHDPQRPQAIYLDLRRYTWDGRRDFTLARVLETVLARSFRASAAPALAPEALVELVHEHGALAICDGLDEVLVHMPPKIGGDFIRELWRLLPPRRGRAARAGKLLLSCRSHYFRTVWEQNTLLRGEEREGLRAEDYLALVLLPFDAAQIEDYLRRNLPEVDTARALDTIRAVHNLPELAERPYTLSLIGEHLPELEARRERGEAVQGVDLYGAMVNRWLQRDQGKHQFNPTHKELLMEHLAAALWRSGRRTWTHAELEDWLDGFLLDNPRLASAYREVSREVLKEDLRTATFIVRPDDETFRFAHTSLQEYFLAGYLHRALREARLEHWVMETPSDETCEFLRQLLESRERERAACEATLAAMLGAYRAQASELALRVWLAAGQRGQRLPRPERLDLRAARLEKWRFAGTPERPLDLRRADLSGADLRGAVFEHVDLSEADLSGADASRAEFHAVTFARARVEQANLRASLWRLSRLEACDLRPADWTKARVIRCELRATRWPEAAGAPAVVTGDDDGQVVRPVLSNEPALRVLTGHTGGVEACAWSPDGQHILSASVDHTLRVWDADTGLCLQILSGHHGWVRACAWSPDSQRIVSASDDRTLRLWDARSGRCQQILRGHRGRVKDCAWSPDGQQILSASTDKTLRLWDAHLGQPRLVLEGHQDSVNGCAWSPDGRQIVSASADKTLRVWDVYSGRCDLVLEGHASDVNACAWSPDGRQIASGSDDKTVRLWDAHAGDCRLVLPERKAPITACAWSPNGQQILVTDRRSVRVWDADSERVGVVAEGFARWGRASAWSPDGQWIVWASYGSLRIQQVHSGRSQLMLRGHVSRVSACAWSPDGEQWLSQLAWGVWLWDADSARPRVAFKGDRNSEFVSAWSPDGQQLLSAFSDGSVRVGDTSSGKCRIVVKEPQRRVKACAWSPDGQQILLSAYAEKMLRVCDAHSGRCWRVLKGHHADVWDCAWSPDGQQILSASADETLRLWDAHSGHCQRVLKGHDGPVRGCAWSHDGQRILSASDDQTLRLWDAHSGDCGLVLEGHGGRVWACAWSPDGQEIVSGSEDNTLHLWDSHSGRCRLVLEGHHSPVRGCVWRPNGQQILSASEDNTVRLWDARSGALLQTVALLPNDEMAVFDERTGRLSYASAGAWRWLAYVASDPTTGALTHYPAELFGPLPGADDPPPPVITMKEE